MAQWPETNGDGGKKKKINHLESAIDRDQKRVATGRGEHRQLLVRRDLLNKVANISKIENVNIEMANKF